MFHITQCLIYITAKFQTNICKDVLLRGFYLFLVAILDFSRHVEFFQCLKDDSYSTLSGLHTCQISCLYHNLKDCSHYLLHYN